MRYLLDLLDSILLSLMIVRRRRSRRAREQAAVAPFMRDREIIWMAPCRGRRVHYRSVLRNPAPARYILR